MIRKSCRVEPARAGRVDLVVAQLTGLSRAAVRGLFDHACVTINGRPAPDAGESVAAGDAVDAQYDPHTRYHEKPRARPDRAFNVLFEDDHLVVVDKAAFILTVPTEHREENTLVQRVAEFLAHGRRMQDGRAAGHPARGGRPRRVHVVHRLDRGTSGILVFARSREATDGLRQQFRRHEPAREYVAVVAGVITSDRGTFESRLATSRSLSRYSTRGGEHGERAVTHFEVEARGRDYTRVRVRLETGRRNQIRVHFAEAGHPVLGDPRYAADLARHPRWRHRRLALHAAVLAFRHPVTGEARRFESPAPAEFVAFGERGRRRDAPPERPATGRTRPQRPST